MKFLKTGQAIGKILIFCCISLAISSCEKDVKELTIRVKSRLYPDFKEEHKVKMYTKFPISDTNLDGVVVEFYADFAIDTLTHKAFSKSNNLNNPAVKVLIIQGRDKKEEIWAFPPGVMPHYSPMSFIGLELADFKVGGKYKKPVPVIPTARKENE